MKKTEIEVEIDETGKTKFHARGFKGRACLTDLGAFERALGKAEGPATPTDEMHQREDQKVRR